MTDVLMTMVVIVALVAVVAVRVPSFARSLRPLVWVALLEYLVCAGAQMIYSRVVVQGGDELLYSRTGAELAHFLDTSFGWASRELLAMLFQQPSVFDTLVYGGGTANTASMYAISGWLTFFLRGSEYAVQVLVSGLALLGTLSIFRACQDACPEANPRRLFVATVLFPSVAFWSAALHKESFCLIGMGALLAAWRGVYRGRWIRSLLYGCLGTTLVVLFRAPAIPPLFLGLAVFLALERFQKIRGADAIVLGPVYLALALGVGAAGMVLVSRISPTLSLDQLRETVEVRQAGWALSVGGSSFGGDENVPQTLGAQLVRIPLALVNALYRPQLFDVTNVGVLMSAVEMTVITWMTFRALRLHGIRGVLVRIQRSPFLLMSAVITVVGCAFVGLVTLNFGSLARYRVPFLPFYGALLSVLADRSLVGAGAGRKKAGQRRGAPRSGTSPIGPRGALARARRPSSSG